MRRINKFNAKSYSICIYQVLGDQIYQIRRNNQLLTSWSFVQYPLAKFGPDVTAGNFLSLSLKVFILFPNWSQSFTLYKNRNRELQRWKQTSSIVQIDIVMVIMFSQLFHYPSHLYCVSTPGYSLRQRESDEPLLILKFPLHIEQNEFHC